MYLKVRMYDQILSTPEPAFNRLREMSFHEGQVFLNEQILA
jgi:hypothetical protein